MTNTMTENERDQLADDATHAVMEAFAEHGLTLPEHEMFALNDYLTALTRNLDKNDEPV